MKIYLAGAITGKRNYRATFRKAEKEVRALFGEDEVEILNPAEFGEIEDWTWVDYIMRGMMVIEAEADKVVMLKDWTQSFGAMIEFLVAVKERKPLHFLNGQKDTPQERLQRIANEVYTTIANHVGEQK